ncbi:MAG: hypothetical protein A2138_23115 [Deltaproteobacteria bacterium RBG_16_71_12]|nr:MAG: hypothetical protein A2138_23115 [Deltaproteobacteria bacterium RBG_16_71_12]
MKKLLLVGVVIAGGAIGCVQGPIDSLDVFQRDDVSDTRRDEPAVRGQVADLFSGSATRFAVGGRLDGAIGPATGLADEAEYLDFYSDATWTASNLIVRGDSGSAMGIFSVSGDILELEVGEPTRSCQSDWEDPESPINTGEGVIASLTGCANTGDPEDGWSYDAPADCTDLEIDEPSAGAPEGTVATMSILSHWSAVSGGGQERTVKATIHLAE